MYRGEGSNAKPIVIDDENDGSDDEVGAIKWSRKRSSSHFENEEIGPRKSAPAAKMNEKPRLRDSSSKMDKSLNKLSEMTNTPLINNIFRRAFGTKTKKSEKVCQKGMYAAEDITTRHRQTRINTEFRDVLARVGNIVYFSTVCVNGCNFNVGDYVSIPADVGDTPFFVAHILSLSLKGGTEKIAHVRFFCRGSDTVLGEMAEENELFLLPDCEDVNISEFLVNKVDVRYVQCPKNWHEIGGKPEVLESVSKLRDDGFWFQFQYEPVSGTFQSVAFNEECSRLMKKSTLGQCKQCHLNNEKWLQTTPRPLPGNSFTLFGEVFCVNDAIFLTPLPKNTTKKPNNVGAPDPFRLALIEDVYMKAGAMRLLVRKMYRAEDANLNFTSGTAAVYNLSKKYYFANCVFWSDEFEDVSAQDVRGKCFLRPRFFINDLKEYFEGGRHRFFFDQKWNPNKRTLEPLTEDILSKYANIPEELSEHKPIERPLRMLDIYAGCGGLSYGLEQSGVAKAKWAIEYDLNIAEAYAMNHCDADVIKGDCNDILRAAMHGKVNVGRHRIPRKGEVELLVGGPPCQGFSKLNHFPKGENSLMKNAEIATFFSYVDFFRPRYVVFENVKNFALQDGNAHLKLCLRALTLLGYQCAFGVLQAGNFGVPQKRRRLVIMGASPGQMLPKFPEAEFTFPTNYTPLTLDVDGKTFGTNCRWTDSAPFRSVTIRDAIYDLPLITSAKEGLLYKSVPTSHFQEMIRGDVSLVKLTEHICKKMDCVNQDRIKHVPKRRGCNWTNLPEDKVPRSLANAKNSWSSVYGRLDWAEHFPTIVCNTGPRATQGKVLHPDQNRILSVRETARAQGFPDIYKFTGTISEKHRAIGNAVPPPIARAVGLQIKEAMRMTEVIELE